MSYVAICPTGTLFDFAGSTAPYGWLMCDGRQLATADYPNLFAVIGYTYGGSGANFNIPDYRGRFARFMDNMGTAQGAAGRDTGRAAGSAQTQTTAKNGLQNAASAVSGSVDRALGNTPVQSLSNQVNTYSAAAGFFAYTYNTGTATPAISGTATAQTITGDAETRPINLVCYKIIKL